MIALMFTAHFEFRNCTVITNTWTVSPSGEDAIIVDGHGLHIDRVRINCSLDKFSDMITGNDGSGRVATGIIDLRPMQD